MIFSRILFHALEKELGLKKLIFTDYFGLTPKTTKSYFDKGIKPGRMLNQLINRLSGIENSKKSSIAKYFAREFLKFFRPHSDKHRIPNEPDPNGIIDSHFFGVIDACRVVGEKPEEYLSQPPPYFYMLNFIESVQLPLRTGLFDITRENFDSLSFPYNKLDKNDAEKYFDVVALDERPAPCNAGPELHRLLIESFAGVVAAVSLDTERLAGGNLKGDPGFLKEAWEKDNIVADFFIWLRENHDSKTHKQFYSCLVPFFNIEPESVETNYKRWCETGILERKQ